MICDATGAGPLQSVELTWSRAAMKRKVRHYTRKEKEKFMLISDPNGSLLRRQPGAGTIQRHHICQD